MMSAQGLANPEPAAERAAQWTLATQQAMHIAADLSVLAAAGHQSLEVMM